MDIAPINVPRLLQNVSHTQWQGIPDETKLGSLHIKSIRISDVKSYYLNYFMSAFVFSVCASVYTMCMRSGKRLAPLASTPNNSRGIGNRVCKFNTLA